MRYAWLFRALCIVWLAGLALLPGPTTAVARDGVLIFDDPNSQVLERFCLSLACRYEHFSVQQPADIVCFGKFCQFDRFAYTRAFTAAKHFLGYCTGFVCLPSEEYEPARRASLDDAAIVPYLLSRFDQSPRGGQIYIALVVRIQDRAKGEELLRRLSAIQNETIMMWRGDVGRGGTVGQLAQWFLNRSDFKFEERL